MFDFRSLFSVALVLSSVCCLSAPQAGTFEAATDQVKARLIASVDAVHAGDEILVGVNQRIIPHWHTYWINPGDSGLATTIDYQLPAGATAGEIQWSTPSLIMLGPVTNYGYENEVTLLSTVKIPSDSKVGSILPIKANVKWLVCEESCIPQKVELTLNLSVVSPRIKTGQGSRALIEAAQASLPLVNPFTSRLQLDHKQLSLQITAPSLTAATIQKVQFYPSEWGKVVHNAPQILQVTSDGIELKLTAGEAPLVAGQALNGVLTVTENSSGKSVTRGYQMNVPATAAVAPAPAPVISTIAPVTNSPRIEDSELVLSSALLLAYLGGIILNLMPCVFPVLSIKALALIKHSNEAPLQTRLHGLAYTVGILTSFALLGGVLIALKTGGAEIGWGFQFQSPLFVLAVAYLMFAVGLSLSGVFSIGGSIVGIGSSFAGRSGYSGSFFTGVLATIVATPCTAPFMGAALGFALTQPPLVLLAVFLFLGLGLATPYLLLSQYPALQRKLPRPGVWMDRLKQGLAFPMYGASVWLVWVLAQQVGVNSVAIALGGMVIIAFAAWLYEFSKYANTIARFSGVSIASLSLGLALVGGYLGITTTPANATLLTTVDSVKHFEPYSAERLAALRVEGKPVFINFTAAWCISCLVNEKVALSQSSVIETFKQAGITYLKGDWTNSDTAITKMLAEFGRSGVPLYVFYPAGSGSKPIVLPQILTPEIVTKSVTGNVLSVAL